MRTRAASRFVSAALLVAASGCYSLSQLRVEQVVRAPSREATLELWYLAPGKPMGGGNLPAAEAVTAILFYPVDVLASAAVAVLAPFDEDLDITWGPVGAAAGIVLPCVTLIPYLYPPIGVLGEPRGADLSDGDFDELIARARRGDGADAYVDLVSRDAQVCPYLTVMSVRLVDERAAR